MDNNAFSFGAIFVGPNGLKENLIQHEYGHIVHMRIIGTERYIAKVAIPSVTSFWIHKNDESFNYYSQPFEYIADYLGQVDTTERNYLPHTDVGGFFYFLYTLH